ncbi:F0F1 ATP synthase subunit delta [Laceyella sacchari]|uniref:ATP synthase subunit delta n=1 Tax=Laceyella sacchari TaxID=37482 RepID=A0ABY5U4I8_LACSH|nr:F0F1 ATP synthase subunit delta [Laceyella sacchari]TCW39257.1 F-type H+-transporting ATPase subunit delta [Laceyella sacchari]UWE03560.1 F0F1 ATP synthase subunit delta [Laceyella sacchari]
MTSSVVAKRYAKALFEVAAEQKCLDGVERDLKKVTATFNASPELVAWVGHPSTSSAQKREVFDKLFADVNQYTKNLLYVLADRRRENIVFDLAQAFNELANEARGIAEAQVTTAFPLTEENKAEIVQAFEPIIGKKIKITEKVDSDILGGVIVQVGDRLFDGSLKTKLARFQDGLKLGRIG